MFGEGKDCSISFRLCDATYSFTPDELRAIVAEQDNSASHTVE